jgi:hypothetical protein
MYQLELRDFILSHDNWEEILTADPYYLKISRDDKYIMFKYNQISSDFSIQLVREARGIIFRESDWECVCHPFEKFGNYGESYCPDINWETASVQEKVDGSLIKFWYDDGWHISTNGTIDAFKANLNDIKYQNFGQLVLDAIHKVFDDEHKFFDMLDPECTYMFELVSPYNRVVIPYEETELYFLGMRERQTGEEWDPEDLDESYFFKIPKRYSLCSLEEVQSAANMLPWDQEGYVVCDANFNRVKIKSPSYVMAHYARNNNVISTERLVQIVLDGEQEEFLIYASDYANELREVDEIMHKIARKSVESMKVLFGASYEFANRGDYAREVVKHPVYMKDFLFHCFDERIFWDYAKSWSIDRWIKAIDEFKKEIGG